MTSDHVFNSLLSVSVFLKFLFNYFYCILFICLVGEEDI